MYVSDPVTYGMKKIAKGSMGPDGWTRECIRGVPQDMGRDTALVGMSPPAWKLRQCGGTDGTRKAGGMACPMDVLGLGARPVMPAIVVHDFGQGLWRGRRGTATWRTCSQNAWCSVRRTRHHSPQRGSRVVEFKGASLMDGSSLGFGYPRPASLPLRLWRISPTLSPGIRRSCGPARPRASDEG